MPRIVGREETVAALCALLRARRFVSIVGPGGIGKTTVAVAAAHALLKDFDGAACFVDFSALTGNALVATTVASALGCFVQAQDPVPGLLAYLAETPTLLILDSCEQVIAGVGALAEILFRESPSVHILTTTREALRAEGEHLHLLPPLDSPRDEGTLTAVAALASPAVQLFMDRANASGYGQDLSDVDAPAVAAICRRLDGIALAIELAASRVGAYGISGIASLLNERLPLLWKGRRSAASRHQTLRATLDWSYNLLSAYEKKVLGGLSVFAGTFTLEAAQTVVDETGGDARQVAEAIVGLVDKSLISISRTDGSSNYRLLDTTRTYAAEKLTESGATDIIARRHALYFAEYLEVGASGISLFHDSSVPDFSPHLGDIRAALDWSFSASGDPAVGVALAARAVQVFVDFSLLGECQHWCQLALAALTDDDRGTKRELELQEALAIATMYTRGNNDDVRAAIERALALAETLGDDRHQLHLFAGLHIFFARLGDFKSALAIAKRCAELATRIGAPVGIVMAEWMLGSAYHLVGQQAAALGHFERGFAREGLSGPGWTISDTIIVCGRLSPSPARRGSGGFRSKLVEPRIRRSTRRRHEPTPSPPALPWSAPVSFFSGAATWRSRPSTSIGSSRPPTNFRCRLFARPVSA